MARVIKAGAGGQKPAARPPTRVIVGAGQGKKVIERALFEAKQDAEHILMRAQEERQMIMADGKKLAARAREEAMARGASEAFAAAAAEALTAFRKRAERYGEAADDVRVLAMEVVRKVLGTDPDLGPAQVDKILQKGMAALRARRRLRLQVSHKRLGELASERPNLMRALQNEPDLVVEGVDDVGQGFARVVTEIGGALCAEETALDALSQAVNVREQPRSPHSGGGRDSSGGNTDVQKAFSGLDAFRKDLVSGTGPAFDLAGGGRDGSVPEARMEDVVDADGDDTINMSPRRGAATAPTAPTAPMAKRAARANEDERGARRTQDDVEEIEAEEDSLHETQARPTREKVPTGAVQAKQRTASRVVPLADSQPPSADGDDEEEDPDETMQQAAPLLKPKARPGGDDDLDLFLDDAPRKRR